MYKQKAKTTIEKERKPAGIGDIPVPTDESSKPRRTGIPCVGTTSVILTASIQLKVLLEF
ncbi:hypothetical protein RUM43_012418 [Polyplax serrata]|uniref:Uncharacterized protein n=1 Tax=Polyplax serrata TaxID=468196 RepID=A0AAN8S7G2_POLSC